MKIEIYGTVSKFLPIRKDLGGKAYAEFVMGSRDAEAPHLPGRLELEISTDRGMAGDLAEINHALLDLRVSGEIFRVTIETV